MRFSRALPFGGNPMKDSNQTPYDWEKDEGVFDQGSSAEQEDEVKSYRSASQEEETPSPAPQEEYEEEQEIQNQEELDEDYRSLLEQISAARSANSILPLLFQSRKNRNTAKFLSQNQSGQKAFVFR